MMCFQCFPYEKSIGLTHQLVKLNYIQVKKQYKDLKFRLSLGDTCQNTM